MSVFIIDIDSTIANNDHRAKLLEKACEKCIAWYKDAPNHHAICKWCGDPLKISQSSWDKFLQPELLLLDTPIERTQEILAHFRERNIPYHYLTGRNETLREVTERWLSTHYDWHKDAPQKLYMRGGPLKDLPASLFKNGQLKQIIDEHGYHSDHLILVDDDPHVLTMYRRHGLALKAPECWALFNPEGPEEEEAQWRR